MQLLTYVNDDGVSTTIAFDRLTFYKSGKQDGKIFSHDLYTLVGVRYEQPTIIKENLTYSELMEWFNAPVQV